MKKYNLSKIMKRAWVLVKRFKETISSALKKAWREAKMKMAVIKGTEKQVKWANDIREKGIEICKEYEFSFAERRFKIEDSAKWFIEEFKKLTYMNDKNKYDIITYLMMLNLEEEVKEEKEKAGEKGIQLKREREILRGYDKYAKINDEMEKEVYRLYRAASCLFFENEEGLKEWHDAKRITKELM